MASYLNNRLRAGTRSNLGELNISKYNDTLQGILADFFSPPSPCVIEAEEYVATLLEDATKPRRPLPKRIHTISVTSNNQETTTSDLPSAFESWLDQNPDWSIWEVDEEEIDFWCSKVFNGFEAGVCEEISALRFVNDLARIDLFRRVRRSILSAA